MPTKNFDALAEKLHEEWRVQTGRTTWQALNDAKKAKRLTDRDARRKPARTPAKPEARVTEAEARAKLAAYIA